MSASTEAWLMVAFMVLIGIGVAVVAAVRDREARRDDNALATPVSASTPGAPRRGDAPREVQLIYTHAAPARPFIVPEARRVMRDHLECSAADCPRKREAHATLVAAGKIVPRGTTHTARGHAHAR